MKNSHLLGAVCAGYFIVFSATVNASLVTQDWQTLGDDLITYDTESDLDWLNITVTQGLSKSYVLGELGTGGAYEGFSYNGAEFITLMEHAGFDLNSPLAPTGVAPYFHSLLGCTNTSINGSCGSTGMYNATGSPTTPSSTLTTSHSALNPSSDQWYLSTTTFEPFPGDLYLYGRPDVGSYLLRAHVPIPPALWLFGSGLLGLVGMARRKAS